MEIDLYPLDDPKKADLIDGSIGEFSPFHETFGYYAHGVGPETASLPANWKSRLIRYTNENTGGVVGLCISPVDLAISKLLAGRAKDLAFVKGLINGKFVSRQQIAQVLAECSPEQTALAQKRLSGC